MIIPRYKSDHALPSTPISLPTSQSPCIILWIMALKVSGTPSCLPTLSYLSHLYDFAKAWFYDIIIFCLELLFNPPCSLDLLLLLCPETVQTPSPLQYYWWLPPGPIPTLGHLAFLYILIDHRRSSLYSFLHLPHYQPNGVCSVASVPLRHITVPFLYPGTHSKVICSPLRECHCFLGFIIQTSFLPKS